MTCTGNGGEPCAGCAALREEYDELDGVCQKLSHTNRRWLSYDFDPEEMVGLAKFVGRKARDAASAVRRASRDQPAKTAKEHMEADAAYTPEVWIKEVVEPAAPLLAEVAYALMGGSEKDSRSSHRAACCMAAVVEAEDQRMLEEEEQAELVKPQPWEWTGASHIQQMMWCLTGSRQAMAIAAHLLPGPVKPNAYYARIKKGSEEWRDAGWLIPYGVNGCCVADNVGGYGQKRHGGRSARMSVIMEQGGCYTCTNIEDFLLYSGTDAEFTQCPEAGFKHHPQLFDQQADKIPEGMMELDEEEAGALSAVVRDFNRADFELVLKQRSTGTNGAYSDPVCAAAAHGCLTGHKIC